jgi:hypothetical protein
VGLPAIALVGPVTESLLETVTAMLTDFGGKPTVVFSPSVMLETVLEPAVVSP